MKILYVASAPDMGGATIALYNLISAIIENHQVVVVFPKRKGELMRLLDNLHVKYYNINYDMNLWPSYSHNPIRYFIRVAKMCVKNYIAQKKIQAIIEAESPSIVHCNVGPIDVSLNACKHLGIPHVWHIREYQDLDFNMKSFPTMSHFRKRIHSKGNYCISITRDIFNHWNLRDVDKVIYDGIFIKSQLVPIKEKKKNNILFVGRIEPAKGAFDAIKGFLKIKPKYKDFIMQIAGNISDNDYYQSCKKLVDESLYGDSIQFLGHRSDIYSLMRQSKAIIVSSYCEGFGFITAEAMLNNCFVIGRNTGGTKEQMDICEEIAHTPLAYRFNDVVELAAGIEYAINNDTTKECEIARSIVAERYNNIKYASDIVDYYHYVLKHYSN